MKPQAILRRPNSGAPRLLAVVCAGVFFLGVLGLARPGLWAQPAVLDLEALLAAGESAEQAGDFLAAEAAYRKAVEHYSGHARAWLHLGEALRFYAHDQEAAERAFRAALDAPEQDDLAAAFAWRGLGEIAGHHGDTAAALHCFQRSLARCPLADTHRSLAHLLGMNGQLTQAAEHAQAAVELQPDDPIALLLCAAHLERAGRREEGRRSFERALELAGCDELGRHAQPVHCCVLYNAAGYQAVCGERKSTLAFLQAFFETPNHRHLKREHVLADPDFAAWVKDEGFLTLVNRFLPEAAVPKP